ncbi:MAG: hypothetical protein KDA88_21375 [Planctomycetaceae bacterium]|nr:hypothetical protein [Planctomycetaceae bacterium]MCB9949498.1 hypothetical protein [Planctomycetaceae bacterium]
MRLVLCLMFTISLAAALRGDDKVATKLPVAVTSNMDAAKLGRFDIELAAGEQRRISVHALEVLSSEKSTILGTYEFDSLAGKPMTVSLNYDSLLTPKQANIMFRVEVEGGKSRGFTTLIPSPLVELTPEEKTIWLANKDSTWNTAGKDFIAFAIVPKTAMVDQPLEEIYPRVELHVGLVPNVDRSKERDFEPGPIARLQRIAEAQKGEIGTAVIEYHYFLSSGDRLLPLPPEKLNSLFDVIPVSANGDNLQAFARAISVGEDRIGEPIKWSTEARPVHTLIQGGNRIRNEFKSERYSSLSIDEGRYIFHVRQHPNHQQIDVSTRKLNRQSINRVEGMRILPQIPEGVEIQETSPDDDRLVLASTTLIDDKEWKFWQATDRQTGFVLEVHQEGGTSWQKLTRQREPLTLRGGVILPGVRMEAEFREGVLSFIRMTCIQSADVNCTIPDDAFRLAVPKGSVLVDYRRDARQPSSTGTKDDIADLTTWLDAQDAKRK